MVTVVPQTPLVKATDFSRKFAQYTTEAAIKGVVEVENHNRLIGAFLSPAEYANYQLWKARERQVSLVNELPDEVKKLLVEAKYGE
ncbi:hypothetical protein ABAC460_06555 [Asticcacaulis sp. AC460]|uniref:hypothetical protein n=1 Tax=Asticcacaulis sp. AC460 TaxID=1282360 RepID=UPI0003C3E236|nr:hypothetical protein [Asticcacaulis sp. AC460]ESQ91219.1 hypothetical protein ABAC460_06555 [Asticcacaulis sp. AC460]